MTPKPNETPKVIGLVALIILTLSFGVWRIVKVTSAPLSRTPTVNPVFASMSSATGAEPSSDLSVASTSSAKAGAGQERYLDLGPKGLDVDPPAGAIPPLHSPQPNAFHAIKPPPVVTPPVVHPPVVIASFTPGAQKPSGAQGAGSQALPTYPFPPPLVTGIKPPVRKAPEPEVSLDGVVTGADSFAVLSIHTGGKDQEDQTIYLRVGDKIEGQPILSISDSGITIRQRTGVTFWAIGTKMPKSEGTPPRPELTQSN